MLLIFDLHQNSSKHHFTFAFQHCHLAARLGYIWDRRLHLSLICWLVMSLWRRGNVFCSQRFLIWVPNELNGLCLLSHWCNLFLGIYLILPYSYCAKVTVAVEQMYQINFFCELWLAIYMTEFNINFFFFKFYFRNWIVTGTGHFSVKKS